MTTLARLAEHRLLPLVVIDDAARADDLAEALVGGGLPLAEIALRTPAALSVIERLAGRGDVVVGAGTVLTPAQVDASVDAGARFVVSPGTSSAVVERCRDRGVAVVPGAVTATEVMAAIALGVDLVKFFPAHASGGPAAIASLAAAFDSVRFVPTGGIGLHNLADYLALPAVHAVGGSWMVPARLLRTGDVSAMRRLVAEAVQHVQGSRPSDA